MRLLQESFKCLDLSADSHPNFLIFYQNEEKLKMLQRLLIQKHGDFVNK